MFAHSGCQRPFRMEESPVWVKAEQDELKWLLHVFAVANCDLQLSNSGDATFTRMLRALEDGEKDVVLGASFTAERAKYLYYSPVYNVDKSILLARKAQAEKWNGKTISQIVTEKAVLLVPKHGWYGDVFETLRASSHKHQQFMFYRHDKDALPDFSRSMADAVLITTRVLHSQPDQSWRNTLVELQPAVYEDQLHIVFSKRSTLFEDVQLINQTITELLARGDNPNSFLQQPF